MAAIPCPWCGERDAAEFRRGGETHIARTAAPARLDETAWAGYLYMRHQPNRVVAERWVHQAGCRRRFDLLRDAASSRIIAVCKAGEAPPGPGSHGGDP